MFRLIRATQISFIIIAAGCIIFAPHVAFSGLPFVKLNRSIESTAYPSTSPLSDKKNEKKMSQSLDEMLKAGYSSEDIKSLDLAYQNRDIAWSTGNIILKEIQNGRSHSKTVLKYVAPSFKPQFESHPQVIDLLFKSIRSYGDRAKLSDQYIEGIVPDFMVIKKEAGQTKVRIYIFDVLDRITKNQVKKGQPITYVAMTLAADKPYHKWFLTGIYIKKEKNIF